METKYTFFTIAIFLVALTLNAQDFQGVATYKSHRKVDLKLDEKSSKNPEIEKSIQEQLRQQFQQEYTLTFNKKQSLYKKNEKLVKPNPIASGIQITVDDGSDLIYKNIKDNRFTNQTEMYGKQFLIKDSLKNKKWELVDETKNIGEYTCFKATFNEEYTTQTITSEGEMESVTKERTTTAWYTPQIPISNGPAEFYGLPGLILEINDGELTLVCTKIVINPSEKVEIEEPNKGKEVTQAEFDKIMEKKNKEMMEQFQSRRKDGENVIIKIGG
ncbi:MAG: GLPGLI family protein [Gelidibacter sp.]